MEKRLSKEIPRDELANVSPPSVERKTARELVPRNSSVELPGWKRRERPANASVPPMPICQLAPPSVVRWTPVPSVATRIVCESLGSTATSKTTSLGQVLSCSAVQVAPRLVDSYRPTLCEPKSWPPATSNRVP